MGVKSTQSTLALECLKLWICGLLMVVSAFALQACDPTVIAGYFSQLPTPPQPLPTPQLNVVPYTVKGAGYTVDSFGVHPVAPFSMTLNWQSAQSWEIATGTPSPSTTFQYRLVMASQASQINSAASVQAMTGPGVLMDWTPNVTSFAVDPSVNLEANTLYYFAVLAQDGAGNFVFYPPIAQSTNLVFNLTPCGASGSSGPTPSQCSTAYANTPLNGLVTMSDSAPGVQIWTVPITGTFLITAIGADGGGDGNSSGGGGAIMQGVFDTTSGSPSPNYTPYPPNPSATQTQFSIIVGQKGAGCSGGSGGGGGGGTYVSYVGNGSASPILIAGGGGGNSQLGNNFGGCPGTTARFGTTGQIQGQGCTNSETLLGMGGIVWETSTAGAGAGFFGNGNAGTVGMGGMAYVNGGLGGAGLNSWCNRGGFGGGGGGSNAGGGGGGYTGGDADGGAGGSYNLGLNQFNYSGELFGGVGRDGAVLIQRLK